MAELSDMREQSPDALLQHLDAAYNLARWLTGNDADAQDCVQEAYLRACRFFGGFRGQDSRPWLLAIVRNVCSTHMLQRRSHRLEPLDEEAAAVASPLPGPDAVMLSAANTQMVRAALSEMSSEFREVIVLHELEGLSYKEVAKVTATPIGTVMSRLSRARSRLQKILTTRAAEEV